MQPQTESSVASIVHDVVDNDIARAEETAEQSHEEAVNVAEAVVEHATIDAIEHENLKTELATSQARIAELERQWQEAQTPVEPEPVEETTPEPIEVEIAAPVTETVEKKRKYLFNHPLKR